MNVLIAIEDEESFGPILDFILKHRWPSASKFFVAKIFEPVVVGSIHSVLPPPLPTRLMEDTRRHAEETVRRFAQRLSDHGHDVVQIVEVGSPGPTIIDLIGEHKIDLVVMSTHSRHGMDRFIYGSVSHWVAAHASCEVLIVHPTSSKQKYGQASTDCGSLSLAAKS